MPVATQVRYDFLNLLLDALNQGVYDEYGEGYEEGSYMPVVVQEEFDFEAPANENGRARDGPRLHPERGDQRPPDHARRDPGAGRF